MERIIRKTRPNADELESHNGHCQIDELVDQLLASRFGLQEGACQEHAGGRRYQKNSLNQYLLPPFQQSQAQHLAHLQNQETQDLDGNRHHIVPPNTRLRTQLVRIRLPRNRGPQQQLIRPQLIHGNDGDA